MSMLRYNDLQKKKINTEKKCRGWEIRGILNEFPKYTLYTILIIITITLHTVGAREF